MSQMEQVVWEDPPLYKPRVRGRWLKLMDPLVAHPNRWALLAVAESPTQARAYVSHLRNRNVKIPHPEDSWEFTAWEAKVYGRYLGNGDGS